MEFEKIAAPSLTDRIYKTLLGKILSGGWKPGDWFPPERDIAEQMGVSRSSLHHAVLQLERDGFVHILPRRGVQVADYRSRPTPQCLSAIMAFGAEELDEPLFRDLMDTRCWAEIECTRLACANMDADTLREMRRITGRLAAEEAERPELIYRYHYLLTQASGNSIFTMLFRAFEPVLAGFIRQRCRRTTDFQTVADMHRELLDHIEARDEAAAMACVKEILVRSTAGMEEELRRKRTGQGESL